jgi:hypothetical protein
MQIRLKAIRIPLCVYALILIAPGCTNAFVNQPAFKAVGAFGVTRTQITPGSSSITASGFGVYVYSGTLGIGWVDHQSLELPRCKTGNHVSVFDDEVVTGAIADHLASGACDASCQRWVPVSPSVRIVYHRSMHAPDFSSSGFIHQGALK